MLTPNFTTHDDTQVLAILRVLHNPSDNRLHGPRLLLRLPQAPRLHGVHTVGAVRAGYRGVSGGEL